MKVSWLGAAFALALLSGSPAPAAEPATGDLHLSYRFAPTGEILPYRLYVPSGYDGKTAMPLVVVLHGSGMDENDMLDRRGGDQLKQMAQARGYILLAPNGYGPNGGYGDFYPVVVTRETRADGLAMAARRKAAEEAAKASGVSPPPRRAGPPPSPGPDVAVPVDDYYEQPKGELSDTRTNELSEQDVMASIEQVRQAYNIDPARIYLLGNSMGGVGAAYLAVKYPQVWAAVAPAGGPVAAWSYPFGRLREYKLPVLFVHGQFDGHANPHWSEVLAKDGQAEGADTQVLVVPGGHHGDAWLIALPRIFDFFGQHARRP